MPLEGEGVERMVTGPGSLGSSVPPPAPQPATRASKTSQRNARFMFTVYPNSTHNAIIVRQAAFFSSGFAFSASWSAFKRSFAWSAELFFRPRKLSITFVSLFIPISIGRLVVQVEPNRIAC